MAIPKRQHLPGTYFVTSVTHNRRRLFQVDRTAQLFLETLQHYCHEGHYKLHAFVVMPDHIHLLLTPQNITLERALMLIKGGFSHRLHTTSTPSGNEASPTTVSATAQTSSNTANTSTTTPFEPASASFRKIFPTRPPTNTKPTSAPKGTLLLPTNQHG